MPLPEKSLDEKKLEAIRPQNGVDLQTPPVVRDSTELSSPFSSLFADDFGLIQLIVKIQIVS